MKRTYIAPETVIVALNVKDGLLLDMSTATVSGTDGGWTKEDNSWDIWSSDNVED